METEQRVIPSTNEIKLVFQCAQCLEELPKGVSPQEWSRLDIGYTVLGIQVWCWRHERNVVHVDFEDIKHPGNFT